MSQIRGSSSNVQPVRVEVDEEAGMALSKYMILRYGLTILASMMIISHVGCNAPEVDPIGGSSVGFTPECIHGCFVDDETGIRINVHHYEGGVTARGTEPRTEPGTEPGTDADLYSWEALCFTGTYAEGQASGWIALLFPTVDGEQDPTVTVDDVVFAVEHPSPPSPSCEGVELHTAFVYTLPDGSVEAFSFDGTRQDTRDACD